MARRLRPARPMPPPGRPRLFIALGAVLGATAATVVAVRTRKPGLVHVTRAVTVRRAPDEVSRAWQSLPGAGVSSSGTVRFTPAPGGRGTEIHLDMRYPQSADPPDLRELKQLLETGEVIRS